MATNMILADIGKINKKFELLSNKLEDLTNLQRKFKDDPFSAGNCAEISTIRHDIELLLRKELIKDIEIMKYTGGPHFGRLRQKRNQALLKYLSISEDMGSEIWKNQEEAALEQNQTPKPLIGQIQAGVSFHHMGPVQGRHQQIKQIEQIERSFEELGQINNDLYELVGTREAGVRFIEQKGEEVVQTMESRNAKLENSTQSARPRSIKRWSWLISVLIILVIIVVIAVVVYNQLRK